MKSLLRTQNKAST